MISKKQIEKNIIEQLDNINLSSKKKRKKKNNFEDQIQMKVVSYIKMKYPNVIFKADTSTGGLTSIGMALKNKKLGGSIEKFPDLTIYFQGITPVLFIELKKDGVKIYKKNGEYYSNEHQIKQSEVLKKLEANGYSSSFGIGFEHCKELIDAFINKDEKKFKEIKIT